MKDERVDEYCRALRPVIGHSKAEALRQLYYIEDDPKDRRIVQARIEALYSRHAKQSIDKAMIFPPPARHLTPGDVDLGMIEYLGKTYYPFGLNIKDFVRHAGIFGSTRSGKTNCALNIIRALKHAGVPVIIIDWEKSYRCLAEEFSDFIIYTVGTEVSPVCFNILDVPPGVPSDEYAKSLISIISHDYLGGQGSDTMMLKYVLQAYQENDGPLFDDLLDIIDEEVVFKLESGARLGGRSGLWKETNMRQRIFMSVGNLGRVITTNRHIPIPDIMDKWVVFELGNLLSPHDRSFFSHWLLNQIMLHTFHAGIETSRLKRVIIMEELHNLVSIQEKRRDAPLLFLDDMFREIGKYGVGLIGIDQTPSEIPNAVFANMNTKISFVQNTKDDTYAMAKAINLHVDEYDYLGRCVTGQAVVSVKQRIPDPFILRATYVKEPPFIPDRDLSGLMSRVSDLSVEIRRDEKVIKPPQGSQEKDISPQGAKLPPEERLLFIDILKRPFEGVDKRTRRLGLHQADMTRAHNSLTEKGMIVPLKIDGKKLFEVTGIGRDYASSRGLSIKRLGVRGGLAHGYGVDKVRKRLVALGFEPELEHMNMDIVDDMTSLGIEVETGKSNILGNVKKLVSANFKYRYILGTDKHAWITIKEIIRRDSGIRVMTVNDFVKLSKDQILTASSQKSLTE